MPQISPDGLQNPERLSFAKIAASGLKNAPSRPSPISPDSKSAVQPPPHLPVRVPNFIAEDESNDDAAPSVTSSISPLPSIPFDASRKSHAQAIIAARDGARFELAHRFMPAQYFPRVPGATTASSNGSGRPPSLDGKSIASATTFALDEKESLRPDDSASVNAIEDEESLVSGIGGMRAPRTEPQDNLDAFRQQFRDISILEPANSESPGPGFEFQPHTASGVLYVPPQGPGVGLVPGTGHQDLVSTNETLQPDPKLLEALESPRDRIWVLKLEQDIFDFVKDPKETSLNLPQCNAYHRMLAHKIADYYILGHLVDDSASAVRLFKTLNSRLPPPLTGITTPSTAASTPPPTAPLMKILRRGDSSGAPNGSNVTSKTTSENDDSGNDDDKKKAPASREEREARYEAARLRIMGSAKPAEIPDAVKEKEDSRSSSAAPKKTTKKKQRSDSEDGFEARSAYSAYYTSNYAQNPYANNASMAPGYSDPDLTQSPVSAYPPQMTPTGFSPYAQQNFSQSPWNMSTISQHDPAGWTGGSMPSYDMSQDFNRVMPVQTSPMARNGSGSGFQSGVQSGFNPSPQAFAAGYPWQAQPQQSYPVTSPYQAPNFRNPYNQQQGYRPSSSNSGLNGMVYEFGQLPSEAYPGRPASKLEHPLPGSYKGKHFNPQSQAFVPTQAGATPATPKASFVAVNHISPGPANSLPQRSVQQSHTSFNVQQPTANPNLVQHHSQQPMMHPLPQPVFPRQPSPSLPLPPKPGNVLSSPFAASSIAKWGAPASLPAKPPPAKPLIANGSGGVSARHA